VLTKQYTEYRPSLKLKISGRRSNVDAVVVMDEHFNLKEICLPDVKWLCVNIVSTHDAVSDRRPHDIRFKIHSRIQVPALELSHAYKEDFSDVLANHRLILQRDFKGNVVGVHDKYKERVRFVRHKEVSVYELGANLHIPSTDPFLHGMKIRVNHGQ